MTGSGENSLEIYFTCDFFNFVLKSSFLHTKADLKFSRDVISRDNCTTGFSTELPTHPVKYQKEHQLTASRLVVDLKPCEPVYGTEAVIYVYIFF